MKTVTLPLPSSNAVKNSKHFETVPQIRFDKTNLLCKLCRSPSDRAPTPTPAEQKDSRCTSANINTSASSANEVQLLASFLLPAANMLFACNQRQRDSACIAHDDRDSESTLENSSDFPSKNTHDTRGAYDSASLMSTRMSSGRMIISSISSGPEIEKTSFVVVDVPLIFESTKKKIFNEASKMGLCLKVTDFNKHTCVKTCFGIQRGSRPLKFCIQFGIELFP